MFYLGVDVAKAKLDCMLLDSSSGKLKSKSIANTPTGFVQLLEWLVKNKAAKPHVVMEPTGMYHESAALALTDAGLIVSLVNPAQLRSFAQGLGVKTKTDKADSVVLARYGATQNPAPWQPPSASARRLKALLARRDAVADDLQRERNRREANDFSSVPEAVGESIAQSIAFLEAELRRLEKMIATHIDDDPDLRNKKDLLETIPGVGPRVASHMTALFAGRTFERAEQLAAYLGLVPVQWESGSSVRGRPHMSKAGPAYLRKVLYMPAVVARRCNPHIKALNERLLAKGKSKMAAIGAAMRKLAHLCFGVVQTGKPYDPTFAM
ncbi:IS110 family transposase [Massilia sp. Mn16-1_5]|uniref:IS110 family transposase n=1 Tax=Massilia sp. Mn16-1_5 TaxID=2079199 RepID=UPI00109E8CBF|nr:IS110 family transposase [Massilia sp. Mn16-1_5]THC38041.1 IS110 family transposase [Massilia sp. Mn16-1_5]